MVTLVVIPTTILLTLFAANLMGYTINRVSLFALIFAIGILVDDAIVVVENIARHWAMNDGRPRLAGRRRGRRRGRQSHDRRDADRGRGAVADAVRLRPDGPLHGADPGQCVGRHAVLVLRRGHRRAVADAAPGAAGMAQRAAACRTAKAWLGRIYRRIAAPVIRTRRSAWIFLIGVGVATMLVMLLFATKAVTVKLLPFDNKSEIAVVVDLPEGASLEDTERLLFAAADDCAAACPKYARSRPMPARRRRSISTGWCGITICANRPSSASCRSIWRRAASAAARAMRSPSICATG